MRPIDADALLNGGIRAEYGINDNGVLMIPFRDVTRSIKNAPTVDAVPVVRCKDCVYWKEPWDGSASPFGKCRRNDMTMTVSGFCSYGERRNDEKRID